MSQFEGAHTSLEFYPILNDKLTVVSMKNPKNSWAHARIFSLSFASFIRADDDGLVPSIHTDSIYKRYKYILKF